MPGLPTLLASSVIRGTRLGESHGGIYRVDLERGTAELKLDWNRTDIDVSGRGGDRGLRGIGFHGQHILVAANSELVVLDQDFHPLEAFTNPFLRHCHEICVTNGQVFLTATGFDSLLVFDLRSKLFVMGLHLSMDGHTMSLRQYDPGTPGGPPPSHRFHLNSVTVSAGRIFFSGLNTPGLLYTDGKSLGLAALLPQGTHNAQLFGGGVLYNDTAADRICHILDGSSTRISVPEFAREDILNIGRFESAVARPGFARGLCVLGSGLIAGGSSPSTIAVYDLGGARRILQQNLSKDVRNAIHGLAIWPY